MGAVRTIGRVLATAGAALPALVWAAATQPAVTDSRPGIDGTLEGRGWIALRLAAPLAERPQALCDISGLRSAVPVEVAQGANRLKLLDAAGVPLAERDPGAAKPWSVLRCQASLPDGAPLSLRWLRPRRDDAAVGLMLWDSQRLDFRARSDWPLAVECTRSTQGSGCSPLEPVRLQFQQPVRVADLAQVRLKAADGRLVAPRPLEPAADGLADQLRFGPLPALSRYQIVWPTPLGGSDGRDLLGRARTLAPLGVVVGDTPPLAKFGGRFGIAERAIGGVVPLTVRQVEGQGDAAPATLRTLRISDDATMIRAYQELMRVTQADDSRARLNDDWAEGDEVEPAAPAKGVGAFRYAFRSKADADTRALPWLKTLREARSQALPRRFEGRAFEVLGVPLAEPGLHLMEVESRALGRGLLGGAQTMYVRAGALVTDLGVHLHLSERHAAVWVTRLSNGQPVADAAVTLYDCQAKVLGRGRANAQGWLTLAATQGENRWSCPVFAFAHVGDDTGFVSSRWQQGIETWRFEQLREGWAPTSDRITHAVLARSLLRPGETLHARLYWRRIGAHGELLAPEAAQLPRTIDLVHQGSGERRSLPVQWDARGHAELVWPLPSGLKRGAWALAFGDAYGETVQFRVEEFRLPLLKAEVQSPAAAQVLPPISAEQPARVAASLRLSYLAGGAAAGESVRVFQRLAPLTPRFEQHEGFWFGVDDRWRSEDAGSEAELGSAVDGEAIGDERARTLDAQGALKVEAVIGRALDRPRVLVTEMEYRDPNGETYRAQGRTPLWPASLALGIRAAAWSSEPQRSVELLAVDPTGRPVVDAQVRLEGGWDGYVSYRRRSVGGFYGYASERRAFKPEPVCEGRTDAHGRLRCAVAPTMDGLDAGEYTLRGTATDAQGRQARVGTTLWFYGGGELWFAQGDHDRIDVLAEKTRWRPGETATLQVRSPFREATAWVNVMRGGQVVDTLVLPISGQQPQIALPIKPSYAPNVFVNVLVMRGRVAEPPATALVDLARPAFKLGLVGLQVGADGQKLAVAVKTDKPAYQTRDKARVSLQVRAADGALPAQREAAVFVIDEALLELLPNTSWDLFGAMLAQRGYGFETASAAMQVLGKRHYGRKALPPGGGGGRSGARELFDTLLLWQGAVPLDAEGRATVEVPINDSLTRFRVVAVANAGADHFGTGEASFTVSKDLQLFSGLPATVREGDRFSAGFTLRNTTSAPMKLSVQATLGGQALPVRALNLAGGEARGVEWPVDVPAGATALEWTVQARGEGPAGVREDALKLRQPVHSPLQPLRYDIGLLRLAPGPDAQTLGVQPPAGSLAGRGEVRVSLAPALAADASGVRAYMRGYPFACLEQRTSKAVSLRDPALWRVISEGIEAYQTASGLLTYYPGGGPGDRGFDVLTSYVLSVAHEAGLTLPEDAQRRALDALEQFVRGRLTLRFDYWGGDGLDLTERKLLALEALSRWRTVPAALGESLRLDPAKDLPQLSHRAIVQWLDVLQRNRWPRKDEAMAAALAELDKRLVDDGQGGLRLRTRAQERRWYFMYSEPVSQVRLALLALDHPALKARADALARAALHLQNPGGHWWDTQANVWGALMLDKRARQASGAITGTTVLGLGTQTRSHDWARQPQGETYVFAAEGLGPQRPGAVAARHLGTGQPVLTAQGSALGALSAPRAHGAELSRSTRAVKQAKPGQWSVGDVVEVTLRWRLQQPGGALVVSDPIPSGATLLGSGLKGQAPVDEGRGQRGWRRGDGSWEAWPAYVERSFTHVRAYYEYLWGEGPFTLTYQMRLNNAGRFALPPVQLEAMYDPEVWADLPGGTLEVK